MKRIIRRLWPSSRRGRVFTVMAVGAGVLSSVALAAWLVSGMGQGNTKIGAAPVLSVAPVSTAVEDNDCYPGGTCDLTVTVTGGKTGWWIKKASITTPITFVSSDPTGCPIGNFSWATAYQPYGTWVSLPSNVALTTGSPVNVTIPDAFEMSVNAPIECAGVTISTSTTGAGGIGVQASPGAA